MTNACPPINAEWLARMRSAKPELLRTLFSMFLADEPKRLGELAEAIAKGDLKLACYHAHSMKGAAATMGMEPLRDACRELEFAARETGGQASAPNDALAKVEREAETVFAIMRQEVSLG
ncbi:MAG: Hpt domain-containing protein [Desulfovibrio sp.]|jgi:HPt (histidine-containing phosphotransfer) domain-containing protein